MTALLSGQPCSLSPQSWPHAVPIHLPPTQPPPQGPRHIPFPSSSHCSLSSWLAGKTPAGRPCHHPGHTIHWTVKPTSPTLPMEPIIFPLFNHPSWYRWHLETQTPSAPTGGRAPTTSQQMPPRGTSMTCTDWRER